MTTRRHRLPAALLAAFALLLGGCTSSLDPTPTATASADGTESQAVIASASPTLQPAPKESGNALGLDVELSSATARPGELVQVTVYAPEDLAGKSVVILAKRDDGMLSVALPGLSISQDGTAYATFSLDQTTTFQAVVPKKALTDEATWPPNAKTLGQSKDFTITVQ